MRRPHACSVVANVVSSAKGDLMNGVVVEEQLEQVVKVNCLYVKDVSQQAKAVALINARATGQSKLASSVATRKSRTTTTSLGQHNV